MYVCMVTAKRNDVAADEQSRQTERKRESGQAVRKKQGKKERIAGRLLILLVAGKKKHPAHAQTVNVTVTSKPKGRCVCVLQRWE